MKHTQFPALLLLLLGSLPALGSGLRLESLQWDGLTQLSVQIAWDRSWRSGPGELPGNHDAVWLFAKQRSASGEWIPLIFSSLYSDYSAGAPLAVQAVADGGGIFVLRAGAGQGDIPPTALLLRLAAAPAGPAPEIALYGIEMAYVPEGPFFLGDGSSFHHLREAQSGTPAWVDSEGEIPAGQLSAGSEASLGGPIPAAWPKGYGAFYLMKYELSQEQYRDFLNSLRYEQQAARTAQPPSAAAGTRALLGGGASISRNTLVISTPGISPQLPALYACEAGADGLYDQPDDGQNRACNFLAWQDLLAYLDWAGLRPLTEFEFEKACRGPELPLAGGFAWGTAQAVDANSLLLDGSAGETVSESATASAGLAAIGYAGPQGPLRCGFGGRDNSGRLQSGAGYWGAMELSGNLWELCVSVAPDGLIFSGLHGDGQLSPDGSADVPGWPLQSGALYRGGAHNSGIAGPYRDMAVSDRYYHDLFPGLRRNTSGGRGGRSAE
jgi:formylglycine-generating enzyme required for sulfatase activity